MTEPETIHATDIEGNLHEVRTDSLSWRPSVYGIVIYNGNILMSPQHGMGYDLPGGGIELHESIEQALIREVKEETGLDVNAGALAGVHDNIFVWKPEDASERKVMHSLLMYYGCELVGGEISTAGFDEDEKGYAEKAVWLPIEKLPDITLASSFDFREIVYSYIRTLQK